MTTPPQPTTQAREAAEKMVRAWLYQQGGVTAAAVRTSVRAGDFMVAERIMVDDIMTMIDALSKPTQGPYTRTIGAGSEFYSLFNDVNGKMLTDDEVLALLNRPEPTQAEGERGEMVKKLRDQAAACQGWVGVPRIDPALLLRAAAMIEKG